MTIAKHWISTLLISFILLPLLLQAADRSWTQVNPLPPAGSSNSLQDAVWGNGKFVAVGGLGIIMTSADGNNWIARPSTSATHLNSIAWNGSNLFVAVGAGGIVLTSSNGTAWTQQESGVSVNLYSVIWDSTNSQFIAAGLAESLIKGTVLTSTDGVAWSRKTPPFGFTILGLATNGTRIVAAATSNVILTSTDSGNSWQKTYQGSNTNIQLYDATLNGSQFLVVGDNGTILESLDDGTTWSSLTSGTTNDLRAINNANGVIIAVGGTASSGTITRSTDGGGTWISINTGNGRLRAITPDNQASAVFSALGTNSLLFSGADNGASWANTTSGTSKNLTGLTWTGSQFAASSNTNKVYLSSDGINWSTLPATTANGVAGIRNIAWDSSSSRYIIIEGNSILPCLNLNCGTAIYTQPDIKPLNGIVWDAPTNHVHVVVGDSGFIAYSPNDTGWIEVSAPTSENLNDVIWDGSRYIAVGNKGTILTSSDGTVWGKITAQTVADLGNTFNSTPLTADLFDISWNGSQYVAVSSGQVFLSHEGVFWEESNLASITTNITGVIWDSAGSRFISVGDGGVILASTGPDLSVQLFPDTSIATELNTTNYTALVSSIGDFDAFSATLTIDLVNNAQFRYSSTNNPSCTGCTSGSSQFTFNLGNIKTGSTPIPIYFGVSPSSTGTMTLKASTRAGILETDIANNKTSNTIKVQSISAKLASEINPISNTGGGAIAYFWMLIFLPFVALRYMRR